MKSRLRAEIKAALLNIKRSYRRCCYYSQPWSVSRTDACGWQVHRAPCKNFFNAYNYPCHLPSCLYCAEMEANMALGPDIAMETDLFLSALVSRPTMPDGTPWEH